jgi:hypothetical protein
MQVERYKHSVGLKERERGRKCPKGGAYLLKILLDFEQIMKRAKCKS